VMSSSKTQDFTSSANSPFLMEAQQLARDHSLGSLQASYTQSTLNGLRLYINALVWFAIALVGFFFLADAIRKISGAMGDPPTLRSIGAIGVISLVVLFGCCIQGWHNLREFRYRHREQVHIYADGIVYLEGRKKSYSFRWDEIDALLRGVLNPKYPGKVMRDCLTIITDKDTLLILKPKVQQRLELCDTIEHHYTDYRLPGMLELYHLGETLEFGDLALNKEYLSQISKHEDYVEESIPWSDVVSLEVGEQFTRVTTLQHPEKPWFEAFTGDIENALILKEIASKIL
jgi:hypothetical protein